jgi:adenylate cyclase
MRSRITLVQAVALTVAVHALLFLGLEIAIFESFRRSIISSAADLRSAAALRAASAVEAYLAQGEGTVDQLRQEMRGAICSAAAPDAIEPCLQAELIRNPHMTDVSFTHARRTGFAEGDDSQGAPTLAPGGRWQLVVYRRNSHEGTEICDRRVEQTSAGFTRRERCGTDPWGAPEPAQDPTTDVYFQTPASRRTSGTTIQSDLAWSELDRQLPKSERRVVFNTLRAIEDDQKGLIGVVRVSFAAEEIDRRVRATPVNEADPHDPHRVFLADDQGRLVTRFNPADPLLESENDLRASSAGVPLEVAAALEQVTPAGSFAAGGATYFFDARPLEKTEGWRVVIVGPEDYYLAGLRQTRMRWLVASAGLFALVLVGMLWALRVLRRGLSGIGSQLDRMRAFDFSAAEPKSLFKDVNDVSDTLEHAKTAMRALGKYAPMDLVRELYASNREPSLGGRLQDVCVMFSDIQDFTQLSERLPAERLAQVLGRYLEVMTGAIHAHEGTVDKYIGDAVMALWNAVRPCEEAATKACRAALACSEAARALCASSDWTAPPLTTRFGIHFAEVMVGHFGAPDRMSFTAVGDGVNLASRLEGLNKQYGTRILVSAAIRERAGGAFAFRRLDRVAVKGKREGVEIYELLGAAQIGRPPAVDAYEAALDAYWRRDFTAALERLAVASNDPPSRILEARCRSLLTAPPPAEWDGTHFAMEK